MQVTYLNANEQHVDFHYLNRKPQVISEKVRTMRQLKERKEVAFPKLHIHV